MSTFYTEILLNHSILLPAIVGIIRRRIIPGSYYPFLFFIWLASVNETLSLVLAYAIHNNTVNSNIYVGLEYLILLYQFYVWGEQPAARFLLFVLLGGLVWCADNLWLNPLDNNNSIFRSYSSFVILLYSIDRINSIIIFEKKSLLKNAVFLICATFVFYYGYKSFSEVINIFHLPFSHSFYRHLWLTASLMNCISNLIFTAAIVWIPKKQEFTLLC